MIKPDLNKSYQLLVAQGLIQDDSAQRSLLIKLQEILDSLVAPKKKSLFSKTSAPVCGLYIYGNVGRGKSMLMDLFFDAVPVENTDIRKRRVHFHAFMQEVHARIHKLRQEGRKDPVMGLAREIAEETNLLCFDELQATDVADATLLYRLFDGLFSNNACIVSTSNRPPAALYTGGVQAERFAKFIELIEEKMTVASLSSPDDYRYQQGYSHLQFYYYPLGENADKFIAKSLKNLGISGSPEKQTLIVQGRHIEFKAYNNKIGIFTFHELCETMLGAADYLALARRMDVIILTGIPKLQPEQHNSAKRFSTLIDTFYEHKIRLICTAAVRTEEIYQNGINSFEFQRTVSRLVEMQSPGYDERLEAI